MHAALSQLDHRPWPLPSAPWTWRQSWCDLLFAHWPVPSSVVRSLVPRELAVQEFEGTSWVGVVPFRMTGVMKRPWPDMPWLSAFPELNVRLYVERGGKPGVWFLSLDATNALAVWAARRFFYLPYFKAGISITQKSDWMVYRSIRDGATFEGSYRPISDVYLATPGSLEYWLTERYCMYSQAPDGTVHCNDVHHLPWPLQKAELRIEHNTMLAHHGLNLEGPPPLLHFARRLDVVVWPSLC